ncbi:hypothetical protein DYBT9275_01850 [Dyadobacter sp. CECT 9275]|uniref:Porin n=1 Tax=Dyadobacter helix TaxID=2822344 RepID=A0A916NBF8_9BACT|nr:porin [Dyadobacter sp. CECT 9275]CAG4997782.1 hypothetical protein DYBT9275_01850 [Dyadobacter sp. CECT 9275]
MKKWILALMLAALVAIPENTMAQRFLMDLVDTTNQMGKGMLSIYERYNRVRISGYIQPQFQLITKKGAETYAGPNFSTFSNNRFMLRRGRLRVDYAHLNDHGEPTSYFVFQFDGTERGVAIRDFWGRFYENKYKLFALTTGMFARPFGHEVNLSSANRETPERGRMSQILMRTERDIGAMLTVTTRTITSSALSHLKLDLGVFNGQGMTGTMDYDSHKDLIGRISLKPTPLSWLSNAVVSAAVSGYRGGIISQSDVTYGARKSGDTFLMQRDSSTHNYGKIRPRNYAGADIQLKFPNLKSATELRAEYIRGKQTATALTSETPGTYPVTNNLKDPLYTRSFDGAYFYFLQNLWDEDHQLVAKYDWYDPNTKVSGKNISQDKGFTKGDIRYNTLGLGYVHHANESLKFVFYYEFVRNEETSLPDFTSDVPDNVFTCRVQYNF